MTGPGFLCVLSVGRGDLKISFEGDDPADVERAKGIVEDMMKRGYFILIEDDDGSISKVTGFDPATKSYLIADVDRSRPAPDKPRRGRPKGATRKVPMTRARATGVAPTGGG